MKGWVCSSEAPKNAQPAETGEHDRPPVARRVGRLRRLVAEREQRQGQRGRADAGDDPEQRAPGVGLRLQPADERAGGDGAEDPEVHDQRRRRQPRAREAEHERGSGADQHHRGEQALDDVTGDEQPGGEGGRAQERAEREDRGVGDEQAPLRVVDGELHGEHGAQRIGGVRHSEAERERLAAQVHVAADDRLQRPERRAQAQKRHERADDEQDGRRPVAAGERAAGLHHRRASASRCSADMRASSVGADPRLADLQSTGERDLADEQPDRPEHGESGRGPEHEPDSVVAHDPSGDDRPHADRADRDVGDALVDTLVGGREAVESHRDRGGPDAERDPVRGAQRKANRATSSPAPRIRIVKLAVNRADIEHLR